MNSLLRAPHNVQYRVSMGAKIMTILLLFRQLTYDLEFFVFVCAAATVGVAKSTCARRCLVGWLQFLLSENWSN